MDVFCPVRYLEPSLGGTNYGNFLNEYAIQVKANKGTDRERNQVVGFRGKDEARSILESCSIVMTKDKWLKNLPEKQFKDIYVQMGEEQKSAYYSLLRNYIIKIENEFIEVDNPLVMLSKLYQISNGFVYQTPKNEEKDEVAELLADETKSRKRSKRKTFFFKNPSKIEALQKLLTGELKQKKAIIWFNMEAEYKLISDMLEEIGATYLAVS